MERYLLQLELNNDSSTFYLINDILMQNSENYYKMFGSFQELPDGPAIVKKLLKLNYQVFASVVTYRASRSYVKNSKLHIITGKLKDTTEIIDFIKKNKINML